MFCVKEGELEENRKKREDVCYKQLDSGVDASSEGVNEPRKCRKAGDRRVAGAGEAGSIRFRPEP